MSKLKEERLRAFEADKVIESAAITELEDVKKALLTPPMQRSYDDLLLLKSCICKTELIEHKLNRFVSAKQMSEVTRFMEIESYKAHEVVFHQGGPADKLYIILVGICEVKLKYKLDLTGGEFEVREKSVHAYKAGEYFGERALESSEPRAATVVTATDTDLIIIPKHLYLSILGEAGAAVGREVPRSRALLATKDNVIQTLLKVRDRRSHLELEAVAQYLKNKCTFFHTYSIQQLMELSRVAEALSMFGRTQVFKQGQVGRAFYVVLTGNVTVWQADEKSENKKYEYGASKLDITSGLGTCVATLEAGSMFGEKALDQAGAVRNASIVTSEDLTELFVLAKADYEALIQVMTNSQSMDRITLLRKSDLFKSVEALHLRSIAKVMEPVKINIDEVLYRKGEVATHIIIIEVGECKAEAIVREERVRRDGRVIPESAGAGAAGDEQDSPGRLTTLKESTASPGLPSISPKKGGSQPNLKFRTVDIGRIGPSSVLGAHTLLTETFHMEDYYRETVIAASNIMAYKVSKHNFFMHMPRETRKSLQIIISEYKPPTLTSLWQNAPRIIDEERFRQDNTWQKFREDVREKKFTIHTADIVYTYKKFGSLKITPEEDKNSASAQNEAAQREQVEKGKEPAGPKQTVVTMNWGLSTEQLHELKMKEELAAKKSRRKQLFSEVKFKVEEEDSKMLRSAQIRSRINKVHKEKLQNDRLIDLELTFYHKEGSGSSIAQDMNESTTILPSTLSNSFAESMASPPKPMEVLATPEPFFLVQIHRKKKSGGSDPLKNSVRTVQCYTRICGTMAQSHHAKEMADMYMENVYITMYKSDPSKEKELLLQWKTFKGFDQMPLQDEDHFIIYCRTTPLEYASISPSRSLFEVPFPSILSQNGKNFACVLFNAMRVDEKGTIAEDGAAEDDDDDEDSDDDDSPFRRKKKNASVKAAPPTELQRRVSTTSGPPLSKVASAKSLIGSVGKLKSSSKSATFSSDTGVGGTSGATDGPNRARSPTLYMLEFSSVNEVVGTFRTRLECMQYCFERFGCYAPSPDLPGRGSSTVLSSVGTEVHGRKAKSFRLRDVSSLEKRDRVLERIFRENKTVCVIPLFEWFLAGEDTIGACNFLKVLQGAEVDSAPSSPSKEPVPAESPKGLAKSPMNRKAANASKEAKMKEAKLKEEKALKLKLLTNFEEVGILGKYAPSVESTSQRQHQDYVSRVEGLASQEMRIADLGPSPAKLSRQARREEDLQMVGSMSLDNLTEHCVNRDLLRQVNNHRKSMAELAASMPAYRSFTDFAASTMDHHGLSVSTSLPNLGTSSASPSRKMMGGMSPYGGGGMRSSRVNTASSLNLLTSATAATSATNTAASAATNLTVRLDTEATIIDEKGAKDESAVRGNAVGEGGVEDDKRSEEGQEGQEGQEKEGEEEKKQEVKEEPKEVALEDIAAGKGSSMANSLKLEARMAKMLKTSEIRRDAICMSDKLTSKEHKLTSDLEYHRKMTGMTQGRRLEESEPITLEDRAKVALRINKSSGQEKDFGEKRKLQMIHETLHVVEALQNIGDDGKEQKKKPDWNEILRMSLGTARGTAKTPAQALELSAVDRLKDKIKVISETYSDYS